SYLAGKTLNTIVLGGKVAISDAALQGLGYDTPGQLTVHFIDVGQGDSILVQTEEKTLLVDGGNRSAGQKVVAYLKKAGITSIDYLIATHPDADHIGGLIDVLQSIPVGRVLDSGLSHTSQTYLDYLHVVDQKNIPLEVPNVGSQFTLSKGISFTILNNGNGYNENNAGSIVAKVTRSEEHTSELQSRENLVCRLLLEKKNYGLPHGRATKHGHAVRKLLEAFHTAAWGTCS